MFTTMVRAPCLRAAPRHGGAGSGSGKTGNWRPPRGVQGGGGFVTAGVWRKFAPIIDSHRLLKLPILRICSTTSPRARCQRIFPFLQYLKNLRWRNHSGNPDTPGGFAPAAKVSPIAMTMYYLQPDSGHRNAPPPPTGLGWRKGVNKFCETGFPRNREIGNSPLEKDITPFLFSSPRCYKAIL